LWSARPCSESCSELLSLPPYSRHANKELLSGTPRARSACRQSWGASPTLLLRRDSVGFLKEHLGFGGLVVSDLGGVDQLRGGSLTRFAAAINAGVDMVMLPGALRLLAPSQSAEVAVVVSQPRLAREEPGWCRD